MNILKKLKATMPPHLKRRFNTIRYDTLPTLRKRLVRLALPPRRPHNPDGKVLIHLGPGDQDDPRYINVDSIPFRHIHYVHNVTRLPMFPDCHADLVYACHVLEHISYKYSVATVQEWYRILKPGGILRLSVPDLDHILAIYEGENHAIDKIEGPLMGGQNYRYNFHMAVFNKASLTDIFLAAGFKEVRIWDPKTAPYHSFTDWSSRLLYGKYPLALNLEAIK